MISIDQLPEKIRLSLDEIIAIREAFMKSFDIADHLWLFGSRANKNKKGGDIDFYIESTAATYQAAKAQEDLFIDLIWQSIGEQRIDVVINILSSGNDLPIYKIAKESGVQLL